MNGYDSYNDDHLDGPEEQEHTVPCPNGCGRMMESDSAPCCSVDCAEHAVESARCDNPAFLANRLVDLVWQLWIDGQRTELGTSARLPSGRHP